MKSVAILSNSFAKASPEPIEYLEQEGYEVRLNRNTEPWDEAKVAACIGEADAAIISAEDRIGEIVFEQCRNLKVIADHGAGFDQIDLEGAEQRGIAVGICPGNHESVADLTWMLILAASRNFVRAYASLKRGEWTPQAFIGTEVCRKTLGIIGYGTIGKLVARRARGFGNTVLVYDPYIDRIEPGEGPDVKQVFLDELLAASDIISLHVPMSEVTAKMINRSSLAKMKKGVILVNTARGGLIDEEALAAALKTGQVASAGLDVFEREPPDRSPLLQLDNVIPVPHIGAQTVDANIRTGMKSAEYIVKFFKSKEQA